MVLTNLKLKLKQTGCANNYFLNYLISADDRTFSKNEIASYPPYSAALCLTHRIIIYMKHQKKLYSESKHMKIGYIAYFTL